MLLRFDLYPQRRHILGNRLQKAPWAARWLKDEILGAEVAEVLSYDRGCSPGRGWVLAEFDLCVMRAHRLKCLFVDQLRQESGWSSRATICDPEISRSL